MKGFNEEKQKLTDTISAQAAFAKELQQNLDLLKSETSNGSTKLSSLEQITSKIFQSVSESSEKLITDNAKLEETVNTQMQVLYCSS